MPTLLILVLAILLEVAGTIALRATDGFTRLIPSLIMFVSYAGAFYLVAQVLKTMPVSVTYAVWSAVGTAAVAAIGMTVLDEPATVIKIASLVLIVVGVVGLNLEGTH
ncbi:MAG: small multidrug resistance pump [Solirubrobacteraceae bacterium]|jgi:small multidrug resistance pump|nr:small multidrug resistance pump [Solirubrobacteraceae bacterium]